MTSYIIPGYGIPKNILKDEHYNHYLQTVFNRIFTLSADKPALIILSGGFTDMKKPYLRNEAAEMERVFKKLMTRSFVRMSTNKWKIMFETKSFTTAENVLFSLKLLKNKEVQSITMFCEETRAYRIRKIIRAITKKKVTVIPIDFDISLNRYDLEIIKERERNGLRLDLWALKHPKNLAKYQKISQERLTYLRTHNFQGHPEVVREWWQTKLRELNAKKVYRS